MDNYHQAKLICVGSTLDNRIDCTGFDNGTFWNLFLVTLTPSTTKGDPPTASYKFITAKNQGSQDDSICSNEGTAACEASQTPGPWPCTVTSAPHVHAVAEM
jgi:hypothetical protein